MIDPYLKLHIIIKWFIFDFSKGLEFEHNGIRQRQPKTPTTIANGQIIIEEFFGRNLVVSVPQLSLKIMYDELTRGFAISIPVIAYQNQLEGICGDCNLDPENDCMSPVSSDKISNFQAPS